MKLKHIDNGFYRLTEHQARQLAEDGKLPRDGYMKLANLGGRDVELLRAARHPDSRGNIIWESRPLDRTTVSKGWIMRTGCDWHDGHWIESRWLWSIVFFIKTTHGDRWIWNAR